MKTCSLKFLLLLLFFTTFPWGSALASVDFSAETALEPSADPIPFGKPLTLVVKLRWSSARGALTPPKPEELELPDFTVIDRFQTAVEHLPPGTAGVDYHLIFTRFEPGEFKVGPIPIKVAGTTVTAPACTIVLLGAEVLEGDDPEEIRGAKPPAELSTENFWLRLLSLLLGLLALLLMLWYLVSKFGLLDRFLSPNRRTRRSLKSLERDFLKGQLTDVAVVVRLVDLLRDYLERQFFIPAKTATSSELIRQVEAEASCRSWQPFTSQLLDYGDQVKFAQRGVSSKTVQRLLNEFGDNLNKTGPKEDKH